MSAKKRLGGQTEAREETVEVEHQDLLANLPTRQAPDWAAQICAAWQKTLDSILETGRILVRAKDQMPYGAWRAMLAADLPFGPDTADRLIAIAEHPVLSDAAHARHLPNHWMTLYDLLRVEKKLGEGTLVAKIEDGTITPKTQRKDVLAMLRPPGQAPQAKAKPSREAKLAKELEAATAHAADLEAARDDIGPESFGEIDRKLARLAALETEVVRLQRENIALQSENDELKEQLGKQAMPAE